MTIVIAEHFIEGPVLIADSRATDRRTKVGSDTATKILPLITDCIVGIVGNPRQAGEILKNLRDDFVGNINLLTPDEFNTAIVCAAEATDPIDINSCGCKLIFCYLDRHSKQAVPVDKLRYHWNKEGKPIVPGEQAFPLIVHLMSDKQEPKEIDFNFPKSHVVELMYPENTYREIDLLEIDAWGYKASVIKDRLSADFYKLWSLESYQNVPWFKTMIAAITMEDIIKERGDQHYIGGFPQVVALTPSGIHFQSYSSGSADQEKYTTMKYTNGYWEQINNKTGVVIKTIPEIYGKRKFDGSEIVDFVYFDD